MGAPILNYQLHMGISNESDLINLQFIFFKHYIKYCFFHGYFTNIIWYILWKFFEHPSYLCIYNLLMTLTLKFYFCIKLPQIKSRKIIRCFVYFIQPYESTRFFPILFYNVYIYKISKKKKKLFNAVLCCIFNRNVTFTIEILIIFIMIVI